MPYGRFLTFEKNALDEGFSFVIGVDEAGRGPLAGPVVAAAVKLSGHTFQNTINDSKKMTPLQRERAFHEIRENSFVGVGIVDEGIIDRINILQATYLAMAAAVRDLTTKFSPANALQPDARKNVCLLIDGNSFKSDLPYAVRTIIDGDALSLSIACASIIAKVTRDKILMEYDKTFPQYGFAKHKGYPTADHKLAIREHGLSPIHRKTFNFV